MRNVLAGIASRIDPIRFYVQWWHRGFTDKQIEKFEREFVDDNITKHVTVNWLTLACTCAVVYALRGSTKEAADSMILSLIGVVTVMGSAWFAISFGAVPLKFIDVSMTITRSMYLAFKVSFVATMIAVAHAVPSPALWPVFVLLYVAADAASMLYDTSDGLRAGLDNEMLEFAKSGQIVNRAWISWYEKYGEAPRIERTPDAPHTPE